MANLMLFASAADIYCRDAEYSVTIIEPLKSITLVLVPVLEIIKPSSACGCMAAVLKQAPEVPFSQSHFTPGPTPFPVSSATLSIYHHGRPDS